ncbi:hypothetical protein GCM10027258_10550 [Amycolatopsis stemonae]
MHARDRELLAGLSKMNSRIGSVTVELLTLQPNDARYAAALRTLARQLAQVGAALVQRAGELDGGDIDLVNLLDTPREDTHRLNGAG